MALRALQCPSCAAPLRWRGDAMVVECRYCGAHVVAETGATTPEPASVVSQPKSAQAIVASLVALGVVATAAVVLFSTGVMSPSTSGQTRGVPISAVVDIDLVQTADQVRSKLGVAVSGDSKYVHVPLDDKTYGSITFGWDEEHPSRANSAVLNAVSDVKLPADVVERARSQLGRTLRNGGSGSFQFQADGVSLSIGDTSIHVSAYEFDPGWEARFDALWTVMAYAALGRDKQITEDIRRDVLNVGYPIQQLAKVNIDVEVDAAAQEVGRVFPGVSSDAETHHVGIGHPWIEYADLRWKNEAGGKLEGINLFYAKEFDFNGQREDVKRCLEPLLGPPKVVEQDHLAGKVTFEFTGRDGIPAVAAYEQLFVVSMKTWNSPPTTQSGFSTLLETLAACGG